jgi:hypothetical protein
MTQNDNFDVIKKISESHKQARLQSAIRYITTRGAKVVRHGDGFIIDEKGQQLLKELNLSF